MLIINELTESENSTELVYDYVTSGHYKAVLSESEGRFGVEFVYETFEHEISKSFTDVLVSDYLDCPKSFGAFIDDKIVGYIGVNHELYNNRMRVTQLLVLNPHRKKGVGKALMQHAQEYARTMGARAMVLETQSCNIPAIRFYHSCGFRFTGCDLACYSNADIENCEVRLELGKPLGSDTVSK